MDYRSFCKSFIALFVICTLVLSVAACTTNPATGEQQFTGLMSASQEKALGAEAHQDIIKEYGGVYNHPGLQAYVNQIGQRIAKNTERGDVTYRFTLLDSPVVNAFALPGGYIYVTRGILSIANTEDELAAVLAHEIGHITARHQSERYSTGVLTSLGASVAAAVIGSPGVSQALSVGTNLYMSSYSRDQESQADQLGIRYLSRTGYDPKAMSLFLAQLDRYDSLKKAGGKNGAASFFSTHPVTSDRVAATKSLAAGYPAVSTSAQSHTTYLAKIRGMTFGDSLSQGFVRDGQFFHPDLNMSFSIPSGFETLNKPDQVIAKGADGSILIMDMARSQTSGDPSSFIVREWLKGKSVLSQPEPIQVNGMSGATLAVKGTVNNTPSDLRLVAIQWSGRDYVRFQIVLPNGVSSKSVEGLKRTTYSLRRMSAQEKRTVKPVRVEIVTASQGDSVQSLSRQMVVEGNKAEWFLAINGLSTQDKIYPGVQYKVIR
ncbi:MAG TPA: M48 family metalloprotease [Alphaproteobacteria bacterium]|nr:M48 family metalloprotease [Alphaproteobacteria bacterium]HOO50919.1 M48 family metalloprotease [Alphaproteobacteria bacterium]